MTRKAALASAALGLILAGIAPGQPLVGESRNITSLASGSGLHNTPEELIITNDTDYANFFAGSPPSSPTVNCAAEDVLAVAMGNQPAGSSINITGIDIRTTGFTAGFGFVHVNPNSGPVTFTGGTVSNIGGTTQNTGGTTAVVGGTLTVNTVIVGGVRQTQYHIIGGATTITGSTNTTTGGTTTAITSGGTITNTGGTTTTTGDTATTTAPVIITGGTIIGTNPFTITNGTMLTSGIMSVGGVTSISGGFTTNGGNATQPYVVVKVAKGALAYAFVNDVAPITYNGPTPFTSLTYITSGGLAPFTETIKIDGIGNVTVNRSSGVTGGTTYTGKLMPTESMALNTAFVNANPARLPPIITDPASAGLTGIPSETLTVTIGSVTYTSMIEKAGFYGGTGALEVLLDELRTPVERIVRATRGRPQHGLVQFVNGTVHVGKSPIDPTDPFYGLIASAVGNKVAFDGIGKGRLPHVVDVLGKVTSDQALLSFPSAGADVIVTIPAGTPLDVTNLTLSGSYFEVESSGQRGFVLASAVSIIR